MSQSTPSSATDLLFRPMTQADIPLGMRLKQQAGWNQTEMDWRRFLALAPEGCFVAEADGTPAGTAVAVRFGPVAWIGMVLVDEAQRGRGIGAAIMRHVLDWLDAQHTAAVRLDATHLGEPIYRKLGFEPQFTLVRMQRGRDSNAGASSPTTNMDRIGADDLDAIASLDLQVTRTDRRALLQCLLQEQPQWAWRAQRERDSQPVGYMLMRPGSNAVQIGPAVALDDTSATELLDTALHHVGDEPAFIDVPADRSTVLDRLNAQGFTEQRRFTRMTRGQAIHETIPHLLASSGPEKG